MPYAGARCFRQDALLWLLRQCQSKRTCAVISFIAYARISPLGLVDRGMLHFRGWEILTHYFHYHFWALHYLHASAYPRPARPRRDIFDRLMSRHYSAACCFERPSSSFSLDVSLYQRLQYFMTGWGKASLSSDSQLIFIYGPEAGWI